MRLMTQNAGDGQYDVKLDKDFRVIVITRD